jgi:hypothetical protein
MLRKTRGIAAVVVLSALSLVAASGASAATEVGNNCQGNGAAPNYTLLSTATAPGATLPITVPAAGVVTKWKVNVEPFPSSLAEKLKVLRPTGNPNEFKTVAESSPGTVIGGQNVFDTRIPVQAGDIFGVYGSTEVIYCMTSNAADVMETFSGEAAVNSTQTFTSVTQDQPAVSAVVEPDMDGDGYGDETQDQCTRSAAIQTACPLITLDSSAIKKGSSVVLLVTTSSSAPVTVSGTVKLAKAPKRRARSAGQVKLSGGTQTVTPGKIARFTLKFPGKLKSALHELTPAHSLKLKVTEAAHDPAGGTPTKIVNVKLKGQG